MAIIQHNEDAALGTSRPTTASGLHLYAVDCATKELFLQELLMLFRWDYCFAH